MKVSLSYIDDTVLMEAEVFDVLKKLEDVLGASIDHCSVPACPNHIDISSTEVALTGILPWYQPNRLR